MSHPVEKMRSCGQEGSRTGQPASTKTFSSVSVAPYGHVLRNRWAMGSKVKGKEHNLSDSQADDEWELLPALGAHAAQTVMLHVCNEVCSFLK